jgi:hypothetical protein
LTNTPGDKVRLALEEIMNQFKPLLKRDGDALVSSGLQKESRKAKTRSDKAARAAAARWQQASENAPSIQTNAPSKRKRAQTTPNAPSIEKVCPANAPSIEGDTPSTEIHAIQNKTNSLKPKGKKAKVVEQWNAIAEQHSLPKLRNANSVTDALLKHYNARLKTEPDFWQLIADECAQLDSFVYDGRWFNFQWIVKSEDNLQKLLAGNYRVKYQTPRPFNPNPAADETETDATLRFMRQNQMGCNDNDDNDDNDDDDDNTGTAAG